MITPRLPYVTLLPSLRPRSEEFWPFANKRLLWGWKRDDGYNSRLVFYSGELARYDQSVVVTQQYFLYVHRTRQDVAREIAAILERGRSGIEATLGRFSVALRSGKDGFAIVEARAGAPGPREEELTAKLRRRRPRRSVGVVPAVEMTCLRDLHRLMPADLYIGSGVSYEAGLPTLCDMHDAFCVDHPSGTRFAHGRDDRLPQQMTRAPLDVIGRFCQVHVKALTAEPTRPMRCIANLHAKGLITQVFTDNVDNLVAKVGVPFIRTRGSGVLNERFDVRLRAPRLIVIGVAADRREVIAQARAQGREVVVVNPCTPVAPRVRHLTYLRHGDVFLKTTADAFFRQLTTDLDGEAG